MPSSIPTLDRGREREIERKREKGELEVIANYWSAFGYAKDKKQKPTH